MADYKLEGPKPARMYEVILPKKIGYFGKVQEVLEDLFNEDAIRAIPFVKRSIAGHRKHDPAFDEQAWVKTLCQASRGYSIYEMDGRYLSPTGTGGRAGAGHPLHLPQSVPRPRLDPKDRLPGRVARGGQPPGRPPVRRGAGRRGRNLVPGIHQPQPGDLAEERRGGASDRRHHP